jgi:hypothetical protein
MENKEIDIEKLENKISNRLKAFGNINHRHLYIRPVKGDEDLGVVIAKVANTTSEDYHNYDEIHLVYRDNRGRVETKLLHRTKPEVNIPHQYHSGSGYIEFKDALRKGDEIEVKFNISMECPYYMVLEKKVVREKLPRKELTNLIED